MTRTENRHEDDAGGAITWAFGVVCIIIAILFLLMAPADGHSLYASAALRQREARVLEWEGTLGGVFDREPLRMQAEVQQELEANAPGEGGTIYTGLDWRATYKAKWLGAGVRWARIEENNARFAETFAELRWTPQRWAVGTFGLGAQQRYTVTFGDPVLAARFSYEISRDVWRLKPAVRANAAYGGGMWTIDAAAEVAYPLSEHLSLVWTSAWERRVGSEWHRHKLSAKMEW